MAYRDNPQRQRKFIYSTSTLPKKAVDERSSLSSEYIKIPEEIPLPNKKEDPPVEAENKKSELYRNPIFDFLKTGIGLEEIILVGIIIVLISEGIEDEFLLLMLVYILIF